MSEESKEVSKEEASRLLEQYFSLKIHDLLVLYRAGKPTDLFSFAQKETDFGKKTPVWLCWMQGFENAPEIVKLCRESWYKNTSPDEVQIIELTFENIGEYVQFPDWIIERHEAGDITHTMLSDILRMNLLYYYGGLWADATYYLAEPFTLPKSDYFALHYRELDAGWAIYPEMWTCNFMKAKKGSLLPRFVMNAFYYYFLAEKKPLHYFMVDFFTSIAYHEFQEVRSDLDACPLASQSVLKLQDLLSEPFDENEWLRLTAESSLFKLSYKETWEVSVQGKPTFYAHLQSSSQLL